MERLIREFALSAPPAALWALVLASCCEGQTAVELRITEFAYNAFSGEFVELTNTGTSALDLTGWSIDDVEAIPGAFDLSPAGVVAPGASIVVTTEPAASFRSEWSLPASVAVLGDNDTAKLSRQDTIHVFDPFGVLVDRLEYGDQVFEYSVRTLHVGGYVCPSALGADDVYGWRLAAVGDPQGSVISQSGDIGSPGRFTLGPCSVLPLGFEYCTSNVNSTGAVAELVGAGTPIVADDRFSLVATSMPTGTLGFAIMSDIQGFTPNPGGSHGNLCITGAITRRLDTLVAAAGNVWEAPLSLSAAPGVTAGSTWSFQLWFRDADPMPTSNFTSAVEVHFH